DARRSGVAVLVEARRRQRAPEPLELRLRGAAADDEGVAGEQHRVVRQHRRLRHRVVLAVLDGEAREVDAALRALALALAAAFALAFALAAGALALALAARVVRVEAAVREAVAHALPRAVLRRGA